MKFKVLLLLLLCVLTELFGQKRDSGKSFFLFVGTYTTSGKNYGIFIYEFDPVTGEAELKSNTAGEENPSFFAFNSDGSVVYFVNEVKNGNISSFKFNKITGELTFLNRVMSGGENPCFIEAGPGNKHIFVGNYGSGTLSAVPLNEDGTLRTEIQTIRHEGYSIDKARQSSPHVHATVLSPDKQFLLVPDLGTDRLYVYAYNPDNLLNPLTPANKPYFETKPGSGPRHLAIHPDSRHLYLIHELMGVISVFDYKSGILTEKQSISILSSDFNGRIGAADIHVSPDGKFLYGSNRGDANDLAIFSIKKDGTLVHIGNQPTLGKMPRNFVIDPTGNFLLVGNQASNEIVIFKRNRKTGTLKPLEKKIEITRPVCLKFAPL